MNREIITTVIESLYDADDGVIQAIRGVSKINDLKDRSKLLNKLETAQGLINKVKRDLNRLV